MKKEIFDLKNKKEGKESVPTQIWKYRQRFETCHLGWRVLLCIYFWYEHDRKIWSVTAQYLWSFSYNDEKSSISFFLWTLLHHHHNNNNNTNKIHTHTHTHIHTHTSLPFRVWFFFTLLSKWLDNSIWYIFRLFLVSLSVVH